MNKKLALSGLAIFALSMAMAQSSKMVSWAYTTKKLAEKTYEVHLTATIGGDFHIYAQNAGDGPVSTSFTFTKNPLLTPNGPVKEIGKMTKVFEKSFNSEVRYYAKTVDFVQTVKLRSNVKTSLAGKVEFMVCNDKECLPPADVDFSVNIGG
ncbi:MAG TPA: protein-disulfide reductase DsbD domain-containing protein [Puia sp.]|nr:protein-disulfide reductase DsbD domain-containing protein [Puia sp.]